jgi:hypothetical protein
LKKLQDYIALHGARKVGSIITVTYGMESEIIDEEIYIPIDKEIPSQSDMVYKPELLLANCLNTTHKGNPQQLQNTL